MATDKQIEANRRNAQISTGPRTPEGKAKCSRNALKHGLASISQHAFLSVEDKSAFDRMLHGYILVHPPNPTKSTYSSTPFTVSGDNSVFGTPKPP